MKSLKLTSKFQFKNQIYVHGFFPHGVEIVY